MAHICSKKMRKFLQVCPEIKESFDSFDFWEGVQKNMVERDIVVPREEYRNKPTLLSPQVGYANTVYKLWREKILCEKRYMQMEKVQSINVKKWLTKTTCTVKIVGGTRFFSVVGRGHHATYFKRLPLSVENRQGCSEKKRQNRSEKNALKIERDRP